MANEESEELRKIKKPVFDEQLQNHLIGIVLPLFSNRNSQTDLSQ